MEASAGISAVVEDLVLQHLVLQLLVLPHRHLRQVL
jgi:hypothetical protein